MNNEQSVVDNRPSYLVPTLSKVPRWFAWWYRLSCLPEPPATAPLELRERFRRARLVSLVIFLMQIFVITSLPAGFSGTNPSLTILLIVDFVINIIAMICNRTGYTTIAGLLVVFNVEMSMGSNIITTPHGLSLATLPLFDLLVIPLVLAASMLPVGFVFLFALLNSAFAILGTLFLPHAPELTAALKTSVFGLVSLPVFIQVILAVISFVWVRSANQAIARADRAEQIALLEHDISESRQRLAEQKEQLEAAIQVVADGLTHATRDASFQRISTQGNVLWPIVGPINNMIARMQRLRFTEMEHQQYIRELEMLLGALRIAQETQQPPNLPLGQSKFLLTPLYTEIHRLYQQRERHSAAAGNGSQIPYLKTQQESNR